MRVGYSDGKAGCSWFVPSCSDMYRGEGERALTLEFAGIKNCLYCVALAKIHIQFLRLKSFFQ
jgi:hypothetical protein